MYKSYCILFTWYHPCLLEAFVTSQCRGGMPIVTSQWVGGMSNVMSHAPLFCDGVARCITKDKHNCTLWITTVVHFHNMVSYFIWNIWTLKLPSLFINLSQKILKWLPYILICHCTSLSPWFFLYYTKIIFINISHHYLTSGGYQVCL